MKFAYFAGGCFWCITPAFQMMSGVRKVTSGYSGGLEVNPTYEQVKHQQTSHRETIAIEYNEEIITYAQLLEIFLGNIDPFDAGGQFIDRGHSYTLAVYYQNDSERRIAEQSIRSLEEHSGKQACIAVEPFFVFYEAEAYHQDYYLKNPDAFEQELIASGRKKL